MEKIFRSNTIICLVIAFVAFSSFAISFDTGNKPVLVNEAEAFSFPPAKDSIGSKKAFLVAYKVLMSPRCMNCHPSGDIPLQGDDSHLHTQGVKRGPDGKGLYALKCSNCHQPQNTPGLHMPPGNPKWHLPPADMKMVFQGKSPKELAAQLKDPKRNGNRTLAQLIDHVTNDQLVLAGWNPGDGRTLPPLSHAEFAKNFKAWIDKGAYLPSK
jgi:hypothetical protein